MAYTIRLSRQATRAIERDLPESVAAAAWEFICGPLASNPQRVGKPLMGELTGKWSARRGQYRIVYAIDDAHVIVHVIRVGHRASIYR